MSSSGYQGRGEPNNVRSIEDRLRRIAVAQDLPVNRVRHRLAVMILAGVLSGLEVDGETPTFLVKGGTAMMIRFGIRESRFSRDLDAMLSGAIEPFVEELGVRGREPHLGFTLEVAKDEPIEVPSLKIRPRRLSVRMKYKGRDFATVKVEISPEEGNAASEYETTATNDLATLGFESDQPEKRLLSVRYQVAQKLHACTERMEGRRNDRAHDLVDLALLDALTRQQLADVRLACVDIFEVRAGQAWPPTLTPEDHWGPIYARAAEGLEDIVPPALDAAVELVNHLIEDIERARG